MDRFVDRAGERAGVAEGGGLTGSVCKRARRGQILKLSWSKRRLEMGTIGTLELAHSLNAQGRLADAEALFRDVLALQPDALQALEGLGVVLYRRRADAAETTRAAIRIEPQNVVARAKLVHLLLELSDPELLDEAEEHARQVLTLAPRSCDALEQLGRVLSSQGRLSEALAYYNRALEEAPQSVSIRVSLGQLLQVCGQTDDAARILKTAESLDPNDARLHVQIGRVTLALDQTREAARHFRRAVAPRSDTGRSTLGARSLAGQGSDH